MTQSTNATKPLQWHPAFYASLQIELADEAHMLTFESEHTLGTKPMLIDVVIIKKQSNYKVKKNIGRIFRKHNIIEYKSPVDYLSIDDFYKVYGYTCFYKASALHIDEISVADLSITFVCHSYPTKLAEHLLNHRKLTISAKSDGIYYIIGDIIPIQLIVTSQLSPEDNLWLNSLTNDIREMNIEQLSSEYGKHENEELYQSAMNIIVHANTKKFEEASKMCEALYEIFKGDIEAAEIKGRLEGRLEATITSCKSLGATREKTLSMIMDDFNYSVEQAEENLKLYW